MNKIPRSDSNLLPESIIIERIQKVVTSTADAATGLKTNPQFSDLIRFYRNIKGNLVYLSQYAGDARIIAYANANHTDNNYDVSVAFLAVNVSYQSYLTWFADNIGGTGLIADKTFIDGVIGNAMPNTNGLNVVLDAIAATVE